MSFAWGRRRPDRVLAGLMGVAMGAGATWSILAALRGDLVHAGLGGGVAGVALLALAGAGWLEGLLLVALSVPLPALLSSETLRLAAAAPVTALAVAAWSMSFALGRRRLTELAIPWRSLGAVIAALVLTTILARSPVLSARELLNLGVLLALLVVATDVFSRQADRGRWMARLLVLLGGVCGVLAVLQSFDVIPGDFPNRTGTLNRAALGFGQPNGLGLFLALLVPLGVHFASRSEGHERLGWSAAVFALLLGLVATFSRGNWIALAVSASFLVLGGRWRIAARSLVYGLLFLFAMDVVLGGTIASALFALGNDWVVEQRLALMLAGVVVFLENPLFGVGPGGFALQVDRLAAILPDLWDLRPTPHNAYVQLAAETGVVGLVTFLVFFFAVLHRLVAQVRAPRLDPEALSYRTALLWSFGVVLVSALFGWPFPHGVGQSVILVMALGLAAGDGSGVRDGSGSRMEDTGAVAGGHRAIR